MNDLSQQQRRELMDRYAFMVFGALFHTGYRVRREIMWRDLLTVGRIGLHLAVADYEPGREKQFARRARRCVKRAVSDWLTYLEIKPGPRPLPRRRCSHFVDSHAGVSLPDVRRRLGRRIKSRPSKVD